MSDIAIQVENLSKQYRLGLVGTGTLSHDLNRWWHRVRGLPDPYLKVGEANDRSRKGDSDYVWALRDINFEIKQGEVVGIIGKNGAGKSTLLKILSQVTSPTTGSIKARGRIASLLEVGTGFHPELTGRENIYLNGTILGMTKREVTRKLDEIVEFSGVARYIDTPVKRYSSGMMVRLGFAVAAHLEPEILIVDEVLAVGDAEFQKKAIGKMQEVSQGGGRTVLFVSHNMDSIQSLCSSGILLANGTIALSSDTHSVVQEYMRAMSLSLGAQRKGGKDLGSNEQVTVHDIRLGQEGKEQEVFERNDGIDIAVEYTLHYGMGLVDVSLHCYNSSDQLVFVASTVLTDIKPSQNIQGRYMASFSLPPLYLNSDVYSMTLRVVENQANRACIRIDDALRFRVQNNQFKGNVYRAPKGILAPVISSKIHVV